MVKVLFAVEATDDGNVALWMATGMMDALTFTLLWKNAKGG